MNRGPTGQDTEIQRYTRLKPNLKFAEKHGFWLNSPKYAEAPQILNLSPLLYVLCGPGWISTIIDFFLYMRLFYKIIYSLKKKDNDILPSRISKTCENHFVGKVSNLIIQIIDQLYSIPFYLWVEGEGVFEYTILFLSRISFLRKNLRSNEYFHKTFFLKKHLAS